MQKHQDENRRQKAKLIRQMKKERQEKIEHQNNKRMQQLRNNAKDTILERELFT
jgi:hypothetical protein